MPGAYDKVYGKPRHGTYGKDGGICMKENMKTAVRGMAVAAIAASVILGSVSAPMKAEAKGTAFINKKVAGVTPTVKSAKRSGGKVNVVVSVPASKVKKLGNVKKITISYGSTKNSKKFEAAKATAKVTKKGRNQYTFTISNKKLASYKNAYMTVRFDGKSNWSKLVKVSGKATTSKETNLPKKDKDGTYASAIHKRFNWDYKGCKMTSCGETLGTWDDGDGWIYVTAQASRCDGCGKTSFCFVSENWYSRDATAHSSCNGGSWGTYIQIAFDKKTGKVVHGAPLALERYPIGTFFMDVD